MTTKTKTKKKIPMKQIRMELFFKAIVVGMPIKGTKPRRYSISHLCNGAKAEMTEANLRAMHEILSTLP